MNFGRVAKSNQEQAVASWVNYLNQVRLERLMEALQQQNQNWDQAVETLNNRSFLAKCWRCTLERTALL